MKNIINTIKKTSLITAIFLLSIFVFSVPTYAHADNFFDHIGEFFEDAWDDVSHTTKSVWDHVENEVEDWDFDISLGNHGHDHNYYVKGYNYWNSNNGTGCSYCGCNSTSSSCSGWDSHNSNTYLPNQPYQYTYYQNPSGWDSYNNYSSLNGSCSAGVSNTSVGGLVTWTASATGGNGFYTYYWSGDEGLSSSGQTAPKTYSYGGTKNATLTITSGGQSITRTCSVNVNQVLAYTETNPYVSSVYLSDVPYTGAGDVIKVILFTLFLILWSTLIAYFLLKRRGIQEIPVAVSNINTVVPELDSDTKAMSQVEDYARMNNIIISNGAVISLIKAKRLNNANFSEIIREVKQSKVNSENEWVTIGEGDLDGRI